MMISGRSLLCTAVFACASMALVAQDNGDRAFPPDQLHADLELLRTTVHEAHADPYRYISRNELDRLFDYARDGLRTALPLHVFIDTVEVVLRAIGDAHTRCDPPREEAMEMDVRTPLLTLEVAIFDSALYVRGDKMGAMSIAPGMRIVSIDGVKTEVIIRTLLNAAHGDGRSIASPMRLVESEFAELYGRHFGFRPEHVLVCDNGHAVLERVVVRAFTREEMSSAAPQHPVPLPWRSTFHPERALAWVELTTLDADILASADQRPERFLGDLLRDLEKKEVGTLVLDLRGAGGADPGMAEQVFALVAQKPFRVAQLVAVRSVTVPTWYRRAVPLDDFYASAGGRFALEETGLFVLPPSDERMKDLPAAHKRFEGTVYVLQDGLTREAGAAVGMLVKRSGRGKLLGEEGGTNALSYCGGRELRITAPNTGVQFTVPLIRYVFEGVPAGPKDLGELPDVELKPDPEGLAKGEDSVRRIALSIIDGLR